MPILTIEAEVLGCGGEASFTEAALMGCLGELTLGEKTRMIGTGKEGVVRPKDPNPLHIPIRGGATPGLPIVGFKVQRSFRGLWPRVTFSFSKYKGT